MIRGSRRAGISVPLFSLRSTRSWGIGEIGDIPRLAEWLRAGYQSTLQILPLNEMAPSETSPYSALSAMAIDPQFISVWMIDGAAKLEDIWRDEIDRARQSPRIDYRTVRSLKHRAMRTLFERFLETDWREDSSTAESLRSFIEAESWWLDDYSLYRALRAHFGERSWPEWPSELRDRDAAAIEAARKTLAKEILWHRYLQWVAAGQWHTVRHAIGGVDILGDFPFMVTLDSADVWSRRGEFMLDASVGTPPDAFSTTGQEWGLPPYNWEVARSNNFEWLRMRARRQAALYDGFRVDHLVGFYRTYVRPFGGAAPYFMPAAEQEQIALGETLMKLIIDSGADVSAEDLGTVPDFVRASIARLGLPGYKVFRWESSESRMYPPLSVAMTGTHDTEPLAEWWETLRPDERQRYGFASPHFDAGIRDAILERVYQAGSNLVLLPIQDVFGWRDRINLPSTIGDQNWTYALPWPVDKWAEGPEALEGADRLAELAYRAGRWHPPGETDD